MSHELRTPLNAIIGFSEVLTDRLFGDLNERQSKYIDNVLVSGRHLLRLINDILDLSKVEAGRVSLETSLFDPAEALRDVHTIVKTLANTKGILLSFDVAPDMPEVTADLQKFKQIMYNLLSNAIKFTRSGGSVKTTASITFEEGSSEPWLQVSVKDTGIGINALDHERIFREFEQVDSSYGREQQGTGLGLTLTKQLVRLHGGRIWLESEEEKGSTFTFVIPVKTEARPATHAESADVAAPALRPQPGRPTVLVAEDDLHASELLEQYITSAGYDVRHAFDGEQAVTIAREIHPAAITLDIMLPKKDGWTVLAELKTLPDTKTIPVVIVSITDDRQLGFSLGATDFLLKPVNKEQLSDVLARAVASAKRIRTMLVVDDEPTTVEFVGDLLHAHGVETLKAYGGREGVAMALEHRPDAIILDLMMPEVTGFDVVRQLREDVHARDIPIVILTAKDLTSDERQELNRNVQAIASKAGGEELLRELARLERVWQ
jgi:CheY-like chemotaxis protein